MKSPYAASARPYEVGLAEKLFRLISDQLEQKGLLLKKGSIIDATLIGPEGGLRQKAILSGILTQPNG